jgi:hypothetical protein
MIPQAKPRGVLRPLPQTGNRYSVPRDIARTARPAGKRMSANRKPYWETRKNRTDVPGTRL